jgi:hypothetical protein
MVRYASLAFCAALACLACAPSADAQVVAADPYSIPPYALGTLAGQAVGGFGFTGDWTQIASLGQSLSVIGPGLIGRPTVTAGNSGDFANFANGGLTVSSGQLYISYNIVSTTTLSSSRMDVNDGVSAGTPSQAISLGGFGDMKLGTDLGSGALADSGISSIGVHHLVGVLDFTNDKIAIFVDPTPLSYYTPLGLNDANASVAWTPPASATFTSYSLVDNLSDQASFGNAVFSLDGASGIAAVPESSSLLLLGSMGLIGAGFLRRQRAR